MSEPLLERLSRFTPDAGRLDRDALLFAAGRASARPNRGWMTLASLLAGTQALSLALLWPRPGLPAAGLNGLVAGATAQPATIEPPSSQPSVNSGAWSARHRLLESETEPGPSRDVTFIDSGPPLRAFPPSRSLLN
jgi:hypothetical protein